MKYVNKVFYDKECIYRPSSTQ